MQDECHCEINLSNEVYNFIFIQVSAIFWSPVKCIDSGSNRIPVFSKVSEACIGVELLDRLYKVFTDAECRLRGIATGPVSVHIGYGL